MPNEGQCEIARYYRLAREMVEYLRSAVQLVYSSGNPSMGLGDIDVGEDE